MLIYPEVRRRHPVPGAPRITFRTRFIARRTRPSATGVRLSISPFPCPRLRLGDLFARHAGGNNLAGLASILVAGRGGKVYPHVCGNVVLRYALTVGVRKPEAELGIGDTLLGGAAVPGDGLSLVLGHALAEAVQGAESSLGLSVPLLGG